jgi:hypothetical protein
MPLDKTYDPGIEAAQGDPTVGTGDADIHISEELLPIRIVPKFLLELIQDGFNFFFAEHLLLPSYACSSLTVVEHPSRPGV